MEKTCSKCKQVKYLTQYRKHKSCIYGVNSYCIDCHNKISLARYRSLHGRAHALYNSVLHRLKHDPAYKDRTIDFSIDDFLQWLPTTNYTAIFNAWAKSRYQQRLSPTIDRINNKRDYTLDNIQVLTLSDNISKDRRGEAQRSAKLTSDDVRQIRKLYSRGIYNQSQIGSLFNISSAHVCAIIKRKYWKHVK